MENSQKHINQSDSIILFDGVCNLCNGYINFIIKRMKSNSVKFGTLQSASGQELLEKNGMSKTTLDTVVLVQNGKLYTKSDVALKIAKEMKGGWPVFSVFSILPKFLRDAIYDIISKNRYRWFGKQDSCMIPTPELKSLFLD